MSKATDLERQGKDWTCTLAFLFQRQARATDNNRQMVRFPHTHLCREKSLCTLLRKVCL